MSFFFYSRSSGFYILIKYLNLNESLISLDFKFDSNNLAQVNRFNDITPAISKQSVGRTAKPTNHKVQLRPRGGCLWVLGRWRCQLGSRSGGVSHFKGVGSAFPLGPPFEIQLEK